MRESDIIKTFPPTSMLMAMFSRLSLRTGRFFPAFLFFAGALLCQASLARETHLRPWPDATSAPALKLQDLEGKEWDIQRLRGQVVVLNFWASWCEPCVDELPVLNGLATSETAKETAKGKVVVLGVNFKESMPAIQRFLSLHEFRYPILVDKTGEYFKKWTSGVMPTTILIDRDGRPRWRIIGELDPTDANFRQALENLLAEAGQANVRRTGSGTK